jgi:hypothetical protein
VHAIQLADGQGQWKLDVNASGAARDAKIYGAPVVRGGKIYLGTCNLDSAGDNQQAVVCIGEKS